MNALLSPSPAGVLAIISDAVRASVQTTFAQIFAEAPVYQQAGLAMHPGPCIAGILSFMGDIDWTVTWVLPEDVAPKLALKFTGMEIPFDSPDMGDVAGELVNVLAGEIVAQMERRRIQVQMSLPTVAKGNPLEFLPERRLAASELGFTSSYGGFWLRVTTPLPGA